MRAWLALALLPGGVGVPRGRGGSGLVMRSRGGPAPGSWAAGPWLGGKVWAAAPCCLPGDPTGNALEPWGPGPNVVKNPGGRRQELLLPLRLQHHVSKQLGRALLKRKLPGCWSFHRLQPPGPHRQHFHAVVGCARDFITLSRAQEAAGCRGKGKDLGVRLRSGPCLTPLLATN